MACITSLTGIWDQVYNILNAASTAGQPLAGAAVSQNLYSSVPETVDDSDGPFPQIVVFYLHDQVIQSVRSQAAGWDRDATHLFVLLSCMSKDGIMDAARQVLDLTDKVKALLRGSPGLPYAGRCAADATDLPAISFRVRSSLDEKRWYGMTALKLDVLNSRPRS